MFLKMQEAADDVISGCRFRDVAVSGVRPLVRCWSNMPGNIMGRPNDTLNVIDIAAKPDPRAVKNADAALTKEHIQFADSDGKYIGEMHYSIAARAGFHLAAIFPVHPKSGPAS